MPAVLYLMFLRQQIVMHRNTHRPPCRELWMYIGKQYDDDDDNNRGPVNATRIFCSLVCLLIDPRLAAYLSILKLRLRFRDRCSHFDW